MIWITKTASGLLIQRDEVEIAIDQAAIASALPGIVAVLINAGHICGQARREGYEAGLIDGRERARIEAETRERIAEKVRAEADELLALAIAPLAA